MNFFALNVETLEAGWYFMMELESSVTKKRYRVFPTIIATNPRYTKFAIELTWTPLSSPLEGVLSINPPGSWSYVVYKTQEKTLSPTTLERIGSGMAMLEEACQEVEQFDYISDNETAEHVFYYSNYEVDGKVLTTTYYSDNENAEADLWLSADCTDPCPTWGAPDFWNLTDAFWDCSVECSTFSNDEDIFGQDTQYFIECTT